MPPDEPNEEEALEKLPQDGATPASLPTPQRDDPDQDLDRDILGEEEIGDQPEGDGRVDDFQELYDEGATIEEPNAGNAVEGYKPEDDKRRQ